MNSPFARKVRRTSSWETTGALGAQGAWFRANRPNGRLHAACDLGVPVGTDVFAIDDSRVLRSYPFIRTANVYALEVRHDSLGGFIVRYGQIGGVFPPGIHRRARVRAGQVIDHVVAFATDPIKHMLHFEL